MNGLPERLLYNHDQFVDRTDEVQLVLSKVQRLPRNDSLKRRTVIFHGQRGTGKSWLLQEVVYQLKDKTNVLSVYLDLAAYATQAVRSR